MITAATATAKTTATISCRHGAPTGTEKQRLAPRPTLGTMAPLSHAARSRTKSAFPPPPSLQEGVGFRRVRRPGGDLSLLLRRAWRPAGDLEARGQAGRPGRVQQGTSR